MSAALTIHEDIETLRSWISTCPKGGMVFFGGAGVSTESGIPDFRSSDGLFMQNYQIPPEQIVSHSFFEAHPADFYDFYFNHMIFPEVEPNQAHRKLAELEQEGILSAIITQNVDGLHQKAGSKNVFELHGSSLKNYCCSCRKQFTFEEFVALRKQALIRETNDSTFDPSLNGVPRCSECGGIVRPDVVLYEEGLSEDVLAGAIKAISQADLMVVAGTSLVVYPAAGLLQYFTGSHLAIVNLQPTAADRNADLCISAKVGEVFDF